MVFDLSYTTNTKKHPHPPAHSSDTLVQPYDFTCSQCHCPLGGDEGIGLRYVYDESGLLAACCSFSTAPTTSDFGRSFRWLATRYAQFSFRLMRNCWLEQCQGGLGTVCIVHRNPGGGTRGVYGSYGSVDSTGRTDAGSAMTPCI